MGWRPFFLVALFNNVLPFSLIVTGQMYIPSGLASILNATTPLFTVAVMAAAGEEKLIIRRMAGVIVGLVGVLRQRHRKGAGGPRAVAPRASEGAPGNGLTIEVRNPAPVLAAGRPKIPGSGAGLVGLAEGAALSGGHLEHGLDTEGAFRLRAWLPWTARYTPS